ncbi:MAG: S46 family peptidase, partial [Ignavibacteriae bacterium]|nr:S46 family peptidase [Ignavibacteriota bacterium]
FTLRLSDGVLESFDYNGTVAIEKTTFYGMYDRYYGSDQTYPWNLPERWQMPPAEFDLSTAYNFISTNDIVGGNSGSAVINKDAEVVGLAFDGNVHSIVGNFIYLPEDNRMVSVASQAIMESLDKVYKAERIVEELKTGKMIK